MKIIRALSERRKQDRATMANQIVALAGKIGITAVVSKEGENPITPRRIRIALEDIQGLAITVSLDGESVQPDVHVLSWTLKFGCRKKLSDGFAPSVNQYHRRKATQVAYGFNALSEALAQGFEKSRTGKAYC